MSFILDALKKSESDRQRQAGPALFEVKIAPPKARFPAWAIAVAALLLVNVGVVGWLLLRHASKSTELASNSPPMSASSSPAPATQSPAPDGAVMPAAANSGVSPGSSQAASQGAAGGAPLSHGQQSSTDRLPAATAGAASASSPMDSLPGTAKPAPAPTALGSSALGSSADREPTLAHAAHEAAEDTRAPGAGNSDDDVPATDAGPQQDLRGHVRRGTASGLMLYQDAAVAAGSTLPHLRLDLHVYAPKPQDRFALVNMQRVHEGDTLPQGVRVESIVPDGVVMSHNGTRFLLPRD